MELTVRRPSQQTILLSYLVFITALSLLKDYRVMILLVFLINLFSLFYFRKLYKSYFFKYVFLLPLFTFFVGAFSIFNFVNPGRQIFYIAENFYITDNGLKAFCNFYFRVLAISSVSGLYIMNIGETGFLKGLKGLRIPDEIILIFSLTLRYIKIFLGDVCDFYIAKKLRLVNPPGTIKELKWSSSRTFLLFKKGLKESIEVNTGLKLRGAAGVVRYPAVDGLKKTDFVYIIVILIVVCGILLIDRGL